MATVDPRDAVIRVSAPARPSMLRLLRSVTASVGARMSMSLDELEELRIAVDEASTLLLDRSNGGAGSLDLELTCDDRSLRARVRLEPVRPAEPDEDLRVSWPWRVISGITDDATIERSDGGLTIAFNKSAPGSDR
jgi:serine/threonine-protein kinase RsbW